MSAILIPIAIITLMIALTALYVASEFATVSARKTRLEQMAAAGDRLARMLLPYVKDNKALDHYVAACQVGITISSLVLGAYGQNTVAVALAPFLTNLGNLAEPAAFSISATGVLIVLTTLSVILGELFPKSVAIQYPERLALLTVIPMRWSLIIFGPLIWLFNGSGDLILKLLRVGDNAGLSHLHSPEEIELLVTESHEGGLVQEQEQQLLRNAFRLRELVARQIMIPRTRMVAAPVDNTVDQLITVACEAGYSRIPLYRSTVDDIIGFAHIKDLFRLRLRDQQDPTPILREIIYVPETLPVVEVWLRLNSNRQYIAIVFDEYGGVAGLITFEDLIEEIFGELQDEFDQEPPLISADKEGRIHLRGDLLVTDVNEYLELELPDEDADTLGGLVFSQIGRLPVVGDKVSIGEPETIIRVEAMEERSVTEVSLLLPPGVIPHITEWENSDAG
jgi:CBS domain containing-hemolysin-like protein